MKEVDNETNSGLQKYSFKNCKIVHSDIYIMLAFHKKTQQLNKCITNLIKFFSVLDYNMSHPRKAFIYSQTCLKRSPLGTSRSDHLRPVTS